MPTYLLQVKADLEGVDSLTPKVGNQWKLDVQNDAAEVREGITVSSSDEYELEGSRGTANFVMRFNKGDQQSYLKLEKLVPKKHGDGVVTAAKSGSWVTVVVLEARGIEPIKFHRSLDFDVKSSGEKLCVFDDADFAEGDWADYDADADISVTVSNIEYRVVKE
jgi:hypothetical protein